MRAGRLNKVIELQSPTVGKGLSGGRQTTWAAWKTVRAAVRPLSGLEKRATERGGEVAEARTEFEIRYRPGVTEQMRVSYNGKFYNIRHVKDVNEDREILVLTCDTGASDG